MFTKSTMSDWIADLFEGAPMPTPFHTPAVVSTANGIQYAICANCDSNIEAWLDEEYNVFGQFGIRVEFANGAMLEKVCHS